MPNKYICNQRRFLVFSKSLVHREMAVKVLGRDKLIHGAGFVKLSVLDGMIAADCFGKSESLNKGVHRHDNSNILKSIGVIENDSSVEAKYVIWRHKVVVFSPEIAFENVIKGSFMGATDIDSAGTVSLTLRDGKIDVVCKPAVETGVEVDRLDVRSIFDLFRIPSEQQFS